MAQLVEHQVVARKYKFIHSIIFLVSVGVRTQDQILVESFRHLLRPVSLLFVFDLQLIFLLYIVLTFFVS